jgi:hypothetical protein
MFIPYFYYLSEKSAGKKDPAPFTLKRMGSCAPPAGRKATLIRIHEDEKGLDGKPVPEHLDSQLPRQGQIL